MILNQDAKRLLIFFFYDKDGIIDRYVPYMLNDMKNNVENIIFVSNGALDSQTKPRLDGIVDTIIERENIGLDVWAYKEALESVGWEGLKEYDEVILMNSTIMGPIYPFKEMFEYMNKQDIDFWGMTKFHKVPFDPFGLIDCGYIPEHLQSHFITVRKSILVSGEFEKYWIKVPMINSYNESVAYHETKFTRHFANLGFKWKSYVGTSDLENFTYAPILYCAKKLIEEKRCPIFKRRSFMHDYDDFLNFSMGENSYELMEYLNDKTSYDTDMIWENILRCYNISAIKDSLHLNFILPQIATERTKQEKSASNKKIALIFHAYFEDLIESTKHYVNSMPCEADIYITTNTEEKKRLLEKAFSNHKFNKLEVILIENRGRDVSALLVASKSFIMGYDYVCFAHDKKVSQLSLGSEGASFAYLCLENTLGSSGYVQNVIDLFEHNPRLGIIMPPPPNHSNYFMTVAMGWGPNFEVTKNLSRKLNLNVQISENIEPVAPLGTMFWFRPQGMKKLFDCDWQYSDFPKEPNKVDGTLLHAIERIYGYVMQDAGYYAAWCFSDKLASLQITNINYMLSGIVRQMSDNGIRSNYIGIRNTIGNQAAVINNLKKMGLVLASDPAASGVRGTMKLYYNCGNEFNEEDSVFVNVEENKTEININFDLPPEKNFTAFRFDPEELGNISLQDFSASINYKNGKKQKVHVKNCTTNGLYIDDKLIFAGCDPQIYWIPTKTNDIKSVTVYAKIYRNITAQEVTAIFNRPSFLSECRALARRILKGR